MMKQHAHRPADELCSIFLPMLVKRTRAEEWARYWQPRLGCPVKLVTMKDGKTGEILEINHGLVTDPFPERGINYPWQAEADDALTKGRRTWANDGTNGEKSAKSAPQPEPIPEPEAQPEVVPRRALGATATAPGRRALPPQRSEAGEAPSASSAPPRRRLSAVPAPTTPTGKAKAGNAAPTPSKVAGAGERGDGAIRPRPGTKAAAIVDALKRRDGATLDELKKIADGSVGVAYIQKLAGIAKLQFHDLGNKRYRLT